jgi:hypothetical protein
MFETLDGAGELQRWTWVGVRVVTSNCAGRLYPA